MKYLFQTKPMSWSQISSWEYSKEQWYDKYVLGKQQAENAEMKFGKMVGEKLASDPTYLPFVPRLGTYEHKFEVMLGNIPLIGFADSFCTMTNKKLREYKTGVKAWDQKRVDAHGQIDMYLLMHFITSKIKPEEMDFELTWLPTKRVESGDFKVGISFVEPIEKTFKTFKTKRTMTDILKFAQRIRETYEEMLVYAETRATK